MKSQLLVIVGQTATGKSGLALQLAEHFNGEIICADSRTVYRGMDIGTAKPSPADQARVRHHCLDIADPDEQITAAGFKRSAEQAIHDISNRGKLPILVGGTGLYIDSVLYDYSFNTPGDPALRAELAALSVPELQDRLRKEGIALPNNPQNPRHLIRAIETGGLAPERSKIRDNTMVFGLLLDRDQLLPKITERVAGMVRDGLEQEVRRLADRYSFAVPPMQTIGYQEWQGYFEGVQILEETRQLIIKHTMAYAKRQKTWFKRNNSVQWVDNRDKQAQSVELTTTFLNK